MSGDATNGVKVRWPVDLSHMRPEDAAEWVVARYGDGSMPIIPEKIAKGMGEPHAIVAVISVLLIGDVILAIGLIRATFSMQRDAERTANGRRENAGAVIGLPGVEVLRAVADALTTVIKGLPKP